MTPFELEAKHPAPTHPDRDLTKLILFSSIVWPNPDELRSHWRSQYGTDYIRKWFGTDKIAQYLRTRSPVCAADIDGWKAREIIAPLFMGDDHEFHAQIRDELILPYLFGDLHPPCADLSLPKGRPPTRQSPPRGRTSTS